MDDTMDGLKKRVEVLEALLEKAVEGLEYIKKCRGTGWTISADPQLGKPNLKDALPLIEQTLQAIKEAM